jgi:hypothetical protein
MRDKHVVVGGVKLWKSSEHPWTCFYAHHWVQGTFAGWLVAWEALTKNFTVSDPHQHRQRSCERLMQSWFELTANITSVDQLNEAHVKMFQSIMDLLAEGYLMRKGIQFASNSHNATMMFAELCEKRRHDQKVTDYYSDLQTARSAKESPKNSFRH